MAFSWIYSTELEAVVSHNILPGIADTIGDESPVMKLHMNNGKTDAIKNNKPSAKSGFLVGGTKIERVVRMARLSARGSTRGHELLNIAPNRTKDVCQHTFGTYDTTVSITEDEDAAARGDQAKINLMETKYLEAAANLNHMIGEGFENYDAMMLAGSDHYHGMNGYGQLSGRYAAAASYGGTNRPWMTIESDADNTWWNAYLDATAHPDADLLDPTSVHYIQTLLRNLVRGTTVGVHRPTNIWTSQYLYNIYEQSLLDKQIINTAKEGDLGFEYLKFKGIPVIWDSFCSDYHIRASNLGPAFGGKPAVGILGRKGFWFKRLGWVRPANQKVMVNTITVDLNLYCDNPRLTGAATRVGDT